MSIRIVPSWWSDAIGGMSKLAAYSRWLLCLCLALPLLPLYAAPRRVVIRASECATQQELDIQDGTSVTLVAEPQSGSRFLRWSNGETANPYLLQVSSDTAVAAVFTPAPAVSRHTLTLYADDCEDANVLEIEDGKTVTLVANPQTGYTFSQWDDGNTTNPRIVTMNSDATYRALFTKQSSTGEGIPTYTVTIRNGSCAEATSRQFIEGAHLTLYATSDVCGTFKQWADGNTDNPRSVVVKGDATYTAEFTKEQYTITATADNNEQGSVSVSAE